MIRTGLVLGAVAVILSGMAALYFLGLILLWTFGLAEAPLDALLRMAIWCAVFALSSSLLYFLAHKEVKT